MYEQHFSQDEKYINQVVNRFNFMLQIGERHYFDVEEFEVIIDHFIDNDDPKLLKRAISYGKRLHPDSLEISIKEAEFYLQDENPKAALELLNRIGAIETFNTRIDFLKAHAYIQAGKLKLADKYFENVFSAPYFDDYDQIMEAAMLLEENDAFELAVKYFEKAFHYLPEHYLVLFDLAYCYEKLDENQKSIDVYKRYLDEDPFSESAWYNLGIAYSKIGKTEEAIDAYEYAIAISPEYASAYFNKANALANAGEYRKSIETYKEYLDFEPENLQALLYIAECYESLDDNINAIKYYKKVVELDENISEAWYGIASVLFNEDKYSECLTFIEKALEIEKEIAEYWHLLANAYSKLQYNDLAETAFQLTLKYKSDDGYFWLSYADFIFQTKGRKDTLDVLNTAKSKVPENANINYRLAALNLLDDNKDSGLQYLETALKINSQDYCDLYEFYPQAKTDKKIENLIASYINK